MSDRKKYAETRKEIIDALKKDLIGPSEANEVLDENPAFAYLMGILYPQEATIFEDGVNLTEQDSIDEDIDELAESTVMDEEDGGLSLPSKFKKQSSIGVSFYIENKATILNVECNWATYTKFQEEYLDKEGKIKKATKYQREPHKEIVNINVDESVKTGDIALNLDSSIKVHFSKIALANNYALMSVFMYNARTKTNCELDDIIFQAEFSVFEQSEKDIFIPEHKCRERLLDDEFYYEQRPIFARGRGCAAEWVNNNVTTARLVNTTFIPEYEIPGVSADLSCFEKGIFSTSAFGNPLKVDEIHRRLMCLYEEYGKWIVTNLENHEMMKDSNFAKTKGKNVIDNCKMLLNRIKKGIDLVVNNDKVRDAFCFMNRVMFFQNAIKNYSKKYGSGIECSLKEFSDPRIEKNNFSWRPFQLAFILINLESIVFSDSTDREIVDLLYFPTGGGKTEAYLGLIAFTIAFRRLNKKIENYNCDGGVSVILRYTLRLLTTQQRDRLTKMIIAAEIERTRTPDMKYGKEPFSIGFWVGGGVTPNRFDEIKDDVSANGKKALLYKQLLTCPLCGTKLEEKDFYIDTTNKKVEIFCHDEHCRFYKYNDNRAPIPVYLVDEEIYAKCPTVILATVDKFAKLPWDANVNSLFGRVYGKSDKGYIAYGKKLSRNDVRVNPFLPPELIIQDELHLITGPLGTIYGAYETMVEKLCTYNIGGKNIKPKYVVSTATIKNANEQSKCLYGRCKLSKFPSSGFDIRDSFFIRELNLEDYPFRKYVGISGFGQSMKTTSLRVYAVLLQKAFDLCSDDKYKDYIDPYYTLMGYFNSIRELGGTVRLIQDDIPKRINRIKHRYKSAKARPLSASKNKEITSRMKTSDISKLLQQLEVSNQNKECLDTAIATNMIAVGMDVDRLGLMTVTGQPKQNSEYIQATSRIGRKYPGLVVTIYNPYRPRDLSHYENFKGYHSQIYRFVEGTTATPFSARARDRVLSALVISAIRLLYQNYSENDGASKILSLTNEELKKVEEIIIERLMIVNPIAKQETINEIERFIDHWKLRARQDGNLRYYIVDTSKYGRLMQYYGESHEIDEQPVLSSMREVESSATMYYWEDC